MGDITKNWKIKYTWEFELYRGSCKIIKFRKIKRIFQKINK